MAVHKWIFYPLLAWNIFYYNQGWPCSSPVHKVYSHINTDAVLHFSADLSNLNSPRSFTVKFHDGSTKARIRYHADRTYSTDAIPGVSITGDTAGNVDVTLENVQQNNAGIYTFYSVGFQYRCNCLYILGSPTKPSITLNKVPSTGESATLRCSSASTTTPSNHSLSLTYNWRVDNVDNPGGSRYSYSTNRNTLTLSNVVKDDAHKLFTCTTTEVVSNGYTSSRSDSFSFDVHYGPENLDFSPSDTSYERAENTDLNPVSCTANCNPPCSFTWTKIGQTGIISNIAVLSLGRLTSSEAGIYTCTATRSGSSTQTKDLTVNVISASFFIEGHKGQNNVTVDEYDTNIQFYCKIDSYKESRIELLFKDALLKEARPSTVLTFTRSSITCSHAGVYTCKGSNYHAQAPSSSINLFVRCSPRPLQQIKQNKTSSLYVSTSLTFTTIAYPEPGPTGFLWHKENGVLWMPLLSNNDLLVSSSGLQSNLTILNVTQSDYGRYKVTATNDIGSYEQYLFLVREDIQKERYTTESCEVESNKTGTIVGICFGVLSAGLAVYATYLTVLHKRRSTKKGKQSTKDLNTQVTYINEANEGTVRHINDSSEKKDDSAKLYTELAPYSKDDKSTYDVIQKN